MNKQKKSHYYNLSANATLSNISVTEFKSPINNITQVDNTMKPQTEKNKATIKIKKSNFKINLFILILNLSVVGGAGFYGYQYVNKTFVNNTNNMQELTHLAKLQSEIENLKQRIRIDDTKITEAKIAELTNQLNQIKPDLNNQVNQQNTVVNSLKTNIEKINAKISSFKTESFEHNYLIDIAYYINLANLKILNENDYLSAKNLLNKADALAAKVQNINIKALREAINHDNLTISSFAQIDIDGIVIKLMALANNVADLKLADNYESIDKSVIEHDDSIEDNQANKQTTNEESWTSKITQKFTSLFSQLIHIEKNTKLSTCLEKAADNKDFIHYCKLFSGRILPEQEIYIKENIKLNLLIASQASFKFNSIIYQNALNEVFNLLNTYFEINDNNIKAFIDVVKELQSQSIEKLSVTNDLTSLNLINQLLVENKNSSKEISINNSNEENE